jgi:hypothetical protein
LQKCMRSRLNGEHVDLTHSLSPCVLPPFVGEVFSTPSSSTQRPTDGSSMLVPNVALSSWFSWTIALICTYLPCGVGVGRYDAQQSMVSDIKTSKSAFVSILKQEQAADYADRSSQQALKQVSKAKATLLAQEKKGTNTATAETKLRQAQSIFEMCNNEKSSMVSVWLFQGGEGR